MAIIYDVENDTTVSNSKSGLFKHFTNEQLYILKRQAVHASYDIMSAAYTREQKDVHTFLLNAIITELRDRAIYHDAQEAGYDKK